jgi:hypothetical protein
MNRERLKIPEQNVRDYAHDLAYSIILKRLGELEDIEEQCRKSGARYAGPGKAIAIDYLNRSYGISYPEGDISYAEDTGEVPIKDKPEELVKTAAIFNGQSVNYGDASVRINALPRVPITIALWRGDEEFGPEGSILFDSTVSEYLTNDDIHSLCEGIAWKMVRALKERGDNPGS